MTVVHAWISYGLGGEYLDPPGGESMLVKRLIAIGVNTRASPYAYSDYQEIINEVLATKKTILPVPKFVIGGDSLGDNNALVIANALRGRADIDLLFGFQRSLYGAQLTVPDNVIEGVEIYNPYWWETFGLGDDPWALAPGNKRTKLRNVPIAAPHPGDFGVAQDIVFNYIKHLTA